MIGFLSGTIANKLVDSCLVMVNNVGYLVNISTTTAQRLDKGHEAALFIHTIVREDAITLYGFLTDEEYELFQLLITVNGIGPKVAQGILSTVNAREFYELINTKNMPALTKLPNIGKKTAERIILELGDKVAKSNIIISDASKNVYTSLGNDMYQAREALLSLGYSANDVDQALAMIDKSTSQEIIREALRILSKF